jgi:pimeloyl-ACP methyl ester carboxylesterase
MSQNDASMPEWFERALAVPSASGIVDAAGVPIHYETWGNADRPGMVLVHGSNAHREWWRFVAPFLAADFRVAALDLSGNGDSGWRPRYSGPLFAEEVMAVAGAAGLGDRPIVVGHSFGGFVALESGHLFGDRLRGVIMVDFTVRPPENYTEWGRRREREGTAPRQTRIYESYETALGRFRLLPEQPCPYPDVLAHMARHALREVDGGWTWKFDPTLFDHLEMGAAQRDKFLGLRCRSAVVLGEHSRDGGAQSGAYMREVSGGRVPILTMPCVHHHMMFEEPVALAMTLLALALPWR